MQINTFFLFPFKSRLNIVPLLDIIGYLSQFYFIAFSYLFQLRGHSYKILKYQRCNDFFL